MKKLLQGISVSKGIGTGRVKIIDCSCPVFEDKTVTDTDREIGRFVRALISYCDATRDEIEYVKNTIGEHESAILNGHIQITHDWRLQTHLAKKIFGGMCAERAVCEICDEYIDRFLEADVDFVRQIATDVKDVKSGVVSFLTGSGSLDVEHFECDTVVIAKELYPSVIARLDREHTKAIVTEVGSMNSHGAYLARAMSIPSVTGVVDVDKLLKDGQQVSINGDTGEIFMD